MDYDPDVVLRIANEQDLLNMVALRAGIRNSLIRASRRFKNPNVRIVEDDYSVSIVIEEGAADAKAS